MPGLSGCNDTRNTSMSSTSSTLVAAVAIACGMVVVTAIVEDSGFQD